MVKKKEILNKNEDEIFINYLESLSREEHIKLILDFAPEKFKKKIILTNLYDKEPNKMISEVEKKIKKIFPIKDPRSPESFEEELWELLEEIEIAFSIDSKKIFELLLFILHELDEALEQGMFYCDEDDGNFDYRRLNQLIFSFLNSLDSDLKFEYLSEFINESEYSDIMLELEKKPNKFFTKEDKIKFKPYLLSMKYISKNFYKIFEPYLDYYEKKELCSKYPKIGISVN